MFFMLFFFKMLLIHYNLFHSSLKRRKELLVCHIPSKVIDAYHDVPGQAGWSGLTHIPSELNLNDSNELIYKYIF